MSMSEFLKRNGLVNELFSEADLLTDKVLYKITKTYCSSATCVNGHKGSVGRNGVLVDEARDTNGLSQCPKCNNANFLFHKSTRHSNK